jgi:hypothetical protein
MQEAEFEFPPNILKNLIDKYSCCQSETKRSGNPPAETSRSSSAKMQIRNI